VRGVADKSPSAIARQVRAFAQAAESGTLAQRDLEGGSITVTNLGMYGVEEFAAIINPPHSSILAVGAGTPTAIVVENEIKIATVMTLVLSVDHRVIDGALAAEWMECLVRTIESPLRLVT
jgi:pyruvate dehydrogenase E2 component (dihydrolipoamide acetyltransferase)